MKSLRKIINNPRTLPIIWLLVCAMFILTRIGFVINFWSDIVWFIYEIPQQTPINMPKYSGEKVWQASRGIVALFTVVGFGIIGLIWLKRLLKDYKRQ